MTLMRYPFTSNHEAIGLNTTVFFEELPMPKSFVRGVCASSITPFHPDGILEGLCHGAHGWISGIPSTVPAAARRLYEGTHWCSTMNAALNRIGPPVGDPQPPIHSLPEAHRTTLAEMLVNLGYEVHTERMG